MSASRARESGLWEWLKSARVPGPLSLHRVENSLMRGFPDVVGCHDGGAFVIELKSVPRPPLGLIWCELRAEQALFLRAWWRAGGSSWVLVQVGVAGAARRYLVPGSEADKLLEPLTDRQLVDLCPPCETLTPELVILMVTNEPRR